MVAANQMVKWEAKSNEDLDKLLEKSRLANERRYFGKFSNLGLNTLCCISLFCLLAITLERHKL